MTVVESVAAADASASAGQGRRAAQDDRAASMAAAAGASARVRPVPGADAPTGGLHEQRRAQILAAARLCFARSGFHGAAMQGICAEARMSPGALYRYFPSKEAIIEAIAEEERCEAAAFIERMRGEAPLLDRLVDCAMDYLAFARAADASSLIAEICAESLRNTVIGRRFSRIDDQVRDTIREIFEEAVARGEIPPIDDIMATIGITIAAVDGIALRQMSDPELTADRIQPLLRRMLAGVLAIAPDLG